MTNKLRPYRFETAQRALHTALSDLSILAGETVGPSDVSWQDVAGTAMVNLRRLACQIEAAREGNVIDGPAVFPSVDRHGRGAIMITIQAIAADIAARAQSEREAGGACEINRAIPYVTVELSDGTYYHFQEWQAEPLIEEADTALDGACIAEDFILASAQGW